jgi:S-DNA-T family DNA segregation ATPase FtsK/SpoIIIE
VSGAAWRGACLAVRAAAQLVLWLAAAVRLPAREPPTLSDGQRGVAGWALCALGVYLGFVIYGHWDGGGIAHALSVALGFTIGRARYVAAPALVALGVAVLRRGAVMRRAEPADEQMADGGSSDPSRPRPLRAGVLCLCAALLLALAAGTLGLSPGSGAVHTAAHGGSASRFGAAFLEDRGGLLGEVLWVLLHALVQEVGVQIVVAFLALAGISLLTGASPRTSLRPLAALTRAPGAVARLLPRQRSTAAAPGWAEELDPAEPRYEARGGGGAAHEDAHELAPGIDEDLEREIGAPTGAVPAYADETLPAEEDTTREAHRAAGPLAEAPAHEREHARDRPHAASLTPQGRLRAVVTDDPAFAWRLPAAASMLTRSSQPAIGKDSERAQAGQQERVASVLIEALGHFGVQARVIGTVSGPHITRYELRLAPGTKVAKVAQLKDDLAYALAATDIRILAPIPGKQAVGVEVPNARRRIVRLGDVFGPAPRGYSPLTVWLGKDVAGKSIAADLAQMPHLLVAGATGSGKSGAINAMLSSVLLRASPHEVRLVLVDPKQVELNHYESIPHLLTPVITNPRTAANALSNLVREMESRYSIMSLARTRSLPELNLLRERRGEAPLPYILCVIDELADLMMVAPADVEDSIIRLAQKARAVGIHLVLATQSPRVDVITGMIKANVPSRIAFAVSSQTDSRVILDQNGAETLLGQGDMLFSPMGSSRLQRIQGAYIDEPQIARITEHWRAQGEPELREELLEHVDPAEGDEGAGDDGDPDSDALLRDAITLVAEMQTASTSMMQRRLRVGYTRAGRLIDMLERRGIISGYEGSKPRQVLISEADLPRVLAGLDDASLLSSR